MNLKRRVLAVLCGALLVLGGLAGGDPGFLAGSAGSGQGEAELSGSDLINHSRSHKAKKKSSKKKSSKKRSSKKRSSSRTATPQHTRAAVVAPPPPPPPPPPSFPEQVSLPANTRDGRATIALAEAGRTYRIAVSGDYRWEAIRNPAGTYRPWADAECASPGATPFHPQMLSHTEPGGDPLDLYINGQPVDWRPIRPDSSGCSPEHLYEYFYVPNVTGQIHFVIRDTDYTDNIGGLTIRITD